MGTVPTLSQLKAWDVEHLTASADHWVGTADRWDNAFGQAWQESHAVAWEGNGAEALRERTHGDKTLVAGNAEQLREAASIARQGASDIGAAQRKVMYAVDDAHNAGFRVGEDLSVTDTRMIRNAAQRAARQAQAQTFAAEISSRVADLSTLDNQVGANITKAAGDVGTDAFAEEPAKHDAKKEGDIQLVGYGFKQDTPDLDQLSPSRRRAVEFVEQNAKGYGSWWDRQWYNEQPNDCSNFVSNALNAGGFKDGDPFHIDSHTADRWFPYSMTGSPSAAWDRADGLYNYIKNGCGKASGGPVGTELGSISIDPTKGGWDPNYLTKIGMQPGDIIVYDWNGGEGISHSSMYVGPQSVNDLISGNGDAVDYHSNNTQHHSWALPYVDDSGKIQPQTVTYRFIHLQYPGEQQ